MSITLTAEMVRSMLSETALKAVEKATEEITKLKSAILMRDEHIHELRNELTNWVERGKSDQNTIKILTEELADARRPVKM